MTGTLFDHALRLHRLTPDGPLRHDGEPCPDHGARYVHGGKDERRKGADAAALLDRHFADPEARPSDLAGAFRQVHVPIHRNDHLAAAALRADRDRVRQTGRWLVRHSTDRNGATAGLALLATDWNKADIPLIQTIGLLSSHFAPLAATALRRRGDEDALLWLARRSADWGRVYLVEELCRYGPVRSRDWLLRHSFDGDYLNAYFAVQVAIAADLHTALVEGEPDDELLDHTGRLLSCIAGPGGPSSNLADYPAGRPVVDAHARHVARQEPTFERFVNVAQVAQQLSRDPGSNGFAAEHTADFVRRYRTVLDRPEWCAAVHHGLAARHEFVAWCTRLGRQLGLKAFTG
ncbi:hypothetical protein [Actinoplanes sp. L3-i22]|uniref:hypothetical protein n=1 Tax=Actinoplanes sp. L3-i22 TaxID=2836373 RepID=UPI001C743461|nr:hypothetical protein [Actinoplanes sp. L3-i22]BCY10475.1 hypothetical protein L3i22_055630 [Actinoplanes sp. L3-i22]